MLQYAKHSSAALQVVPAVYVFDKLQSCGVTLGLKVMTPCCFRIAAELNAVLKYPSYLQSQCKPAISFGFEVNGHSLWLGPQFAF